MKALRVHLNIFLPVASKGLLNDAEILSSAWCSCLPNTTVHIVSKNKGIAFAFFQLIGIVFRKFTFRKQIAFHLEEVQSGLKRFNDLNIFIPNQEWLRSLSAAEMAKSDVITLVKSKYALAKVKSIASEIYYLGFSSRDINLPNVKPDYGKFLHVGGKSPQKGTLAVLECWAKHPEWPQLTVISSLPEATELSEHNNIRLITNFITDKELVHIANTHGIHLCPSKAEGFGHTIVEGLSTNAIVLTTNSGVMAELVTDEGCLIKASAKEQRYFSDLYEISESDLEEKIEDILQTDIRQLKIRGEESRERYIEINARFRDSVSKIVSNVVLQKVIKD
jgi:glycosyltransferase involved in cell wall biosynthesis